MPGPMMALVWLIDLGMVTLDILVGRRKVHPALRFGLWAATLGGVAAGAAVVCTVAVLLWK